MCSSIAGIVLETYGSGNAPSNRPDILNLIKDACERGVIVVNISQCSQGTVSNSYETGKALYNLGVVGGGDMTPESALTKLSYVLGKGMSVDECRKAMSENIRGELTEIASRKQFSYLSSPVTSKTSEMLNNVLLADSTDSGLEKAVVPMLLCNAARSDNISLMKEVLTDFAFMINCVDYDGRSPLHVASSEGNISSVKYLLEMGANLHLRDRFGHSPLWDALKSRNKTVIELLRSGGAHFSSEQEAEIENEITRTIFDGDIEMLKLIKECGVDFKQKVRIYDEGWLGLAIKSNRLDFVEFFAQTTTVTERIVAQANEIGYTDITQYLRRRIRK